MLKFNHRLPALGLIVLLPVMFADDHSSQTGGRDVKVSEEVAVPEERNSNRIDYIEIPAADVQVAKKFFGEVFGWEFVDYGPEYAGFNDGRLDGGFRKDEAVGRSGPLVVFYDANLEAKVAVIKKAGGEIVKEIFDFPGGRRFHFTDLHGNEFAVWSDKIVAQRAHNEAR